MSRNLGDHFFNKSTKAHSASVHMQGRCKRGTLSCRSLPKRATFSTILCMSLTFLNIHLVSCQLSVKRSNACCQYSGMIPTVIRLLSTVNPKIIWTVPINNSSHLKKERTLADFNYWATTDYKNRFNDGSKEPQNILLSYTGGQDIINIDMPQEVCASPVHPNSKGT